METDTKPGATGDISLRQGEIPAGMQLAALDRLRDQMPLVVFTEEKRRLIREQVCPAGIKDGEFEVFMLQCIRSGLDPLLKQAFCVTRPTKFKEQQRGSGGGTITVDVWRDVHTFQPAVAGMLARAEQFPDYRGTTGACFYEGEEVYPDYVHGVVHHKPMNAAVAKRPKLLGAWCRVAREGRTPVVVIRYYDACVQLDRSGKPTPMWSAHAEMMMLKCPQAAALRLAFPSAFGGLYDAAEGRAVEEGTADEATFTAPVVPQMRPPPPREQAVDAEFTSEREADDLLASAGLPESPAPEEEPPPSSWSDEPPQPGDVLEVVNGGEEIALRAKAADLQKRISEAETMEALLAVSKEVKALPAGPVREATASLYNAKRRKLAQP